MNFKKDFTIVIADDHPITLKGLRDELVTNGYTVIGMAKNGLEALEMVLEFQPDVALLDIDMPKVTGFDILKMAKEKGIDTKGIVLSFHKEIEYILQAKKLNVHGYLLKEDSFSVIEMCMQMVLKGAQFYSPSFENNELQNASQSIKRLGLLTPSEKRILKYIAEEVTTQEIADILCVSPRTIEKHRSNIIEKLQINSQTNALFQWVLKNKDIIFNL